MRKTLSSNLSRCTINNMKYIRPSRRNQNYSWKCKYCNIEYKDGRKLGGHLTSCKLNPKRKEIDEKIRLKSIGRKHTEETKKHLSEDKIKYLTEHPDKVPYLLNHSSKRSYPELLFEKALKNANISGWISAYRNGIYEYDFAFPELKLDIEIDGSTHKTQKVINIDKRRDKWSKEEGWTVIRFEAQDVKKNVDECIERLRRLL